MAASPVSINSGSIVPSPSSNHRRRPLVLTPRRLDANRRNARRSTGPRTIEGKAKVARNPIKHGFFAGSEKWRPTQRRDFAEILAGLRDEFKPDGVLQEDCVATMAASFVRMAAMLRWENIAALKYHKEQERALNDRIAAAAPAEAAFLEATRAELRRAGLWRPTIPGPREAKAIIRYSGNLDRTIRRALANLEGRKSLRPGEISRTSKMQKQTHYEASPSSGPEALRRASAKRFDPPSPSSGPEALRRASAKRFDPPSPSSGPEALQRASGGTAQPIELQKQTHFEASPATPESAKANPLNSTFMGNRHERRRAKALAGRRT